MLRRPSFLCTSVLMLMSASCGGGGNDVAEVSFAMAGDSTTVPDASAMAAVMPGASALTNRGYSTATQYPTDFCATGNYPEQWEWRPEIANKQPGPATSGQPAVRHVWAGKVIATYAKLSGYRSAPNNVDAHDTSVGPFRRFPYLQWQEGDVFEVMPAVYEGEDQQIYIGPNVLNDAAYAARQSVVPKNITIRGITVNGVRPVIKLPATGASNANFGQALIYIGAAENITIENLDVSSSTTGLGGLGKAGIYINGGKNISLKNVRVSGFSNKSANGIFATGLNSGTLLLSGVELANNGGGSGPEHNIYVNASSVDPAYTVKMVGSWSHDSVYGHLFKSRAQSNYLEGNYFQGSKSKGTGDMRESWMVDIPEGGAFTARNNIFSKNKSGDSTNGAAITYGVERAVGTFDTLRPWSLRIENNTFVAFTRYFDNQSHPVYPMFIKTGVPVLPANLSVKRNLFVGYCQTPTNNLNQQGYRGEDYQIVDFNAIDTAFRPRLPVMAGTAQLAGSQAYFHRMTTIWRTTAAIGAQD